MIFIVICDLIVFSNSDRYGGNSVVYCRVFDLANELSTAEMDASHTIPGKPNRHTKTLGAARKNLIVSHETVFPKHVQLAATIRQSADVTST